MCVCVCVCVLLYGLARTYNHSVFNRLLVNELVVVVVVIELFSLGDDHTWDI